MNPYEVLGLPRDASLRSIRAAYRRLAKSCHPDTGGDPVKFAQLKLAHDILIDPDRRARFDATGDVSEATPDNTLSNTLSFLSVVLEQVVQQNINYIENVDLVAQLKKVLHLQRANALTQDKNTDQTILYWMKIAGRLHTKSERNYLLEICQGKISSLKASKHNYAAQIESIDRALKLLDDASYDFMSANMNRFSGMPNHSIFNYVPNTASTSTR